jgi:hypothetical protein
MTKISITKRADLPFLFRIEFLILLLLLPFGIYLEFGACDLEFIS